jgi:uncharacterized protein (TIGR01319 family)
VVLRGLEEPTIKRTVEGDLGMRVSAPTAASSAADTLSKMLEENEREAFDAFISHVAQTPEYLPTDPQEDRFDNYLATACIHGAIRRHAGTWRRIFTTAGETFLQHGKDLRRISKVIGSGGFLSAMSGFIPQTVGDEPHSEMISLAPQRYAYLRDRNYLIPLLGAIAVEFPRQAAMCAIENICFGGEYASQAERFGDAAHSGDATMH